MRRKSIKIAILVLLICVSALLSCALFGEQEAVALDDKISVTIKAEILSGVKTWTVVDGDDMPIDSFTGSYGSIELHNSLRGTLANSLFEKGKIDEATRDDYASDGGWIHQYFDVDFSFACVQNVQSNVSEIVYGNEQEGIEVSAEIAPIVSSPSAYIEFQKSGDVSWQKVQSNNATVLFGKGIDVGNYEIRYVAVEEFKFDGKDYSVERHADNTLNVRINKADLQMPSIDVVHATYGTKACDINVLDYVKSQSFPKDNGGHFVVCDEQSDEAFASVSDKKNVLLSVKEGGYTVKFDFIHDSGNYNVLNGVSVNVVIQPKPITVKISDVSSLVGEALFPLDRVKYTVVDALVNGDKIEDLGLKLNCDADNQNVGTYFITATFENENYTPISANQDFQLVPGGRYLVFDKSVGVVSPDGVVFKIYFEQGFVEIMSAKIEIIEAQSADSDKKIVRGYRISLVDSSGNVVEVDGNYYVSWVDGINDATWVSIGLDKGSIMSINAVTNGLALDKDNNEIYFYTDVPKAIEQSGLSGGYIALICVACILIVCIIVLVAMYLCLRKARRSAINSIPCEIAQNDVYIRETVDKTADCAINNGEDVEQNGDKKLRHGKKNKRRGARKDV